MTLHSKFIRVTAAFLATAALLAACGGDDGGDDDPGTTAPAGSDASTATTAGGEGGESTAPAEALDVSFAVDGFTLGTLAFVADAEGFFTSAGIKPSTQQYGTGIEAIQAVIARQADMGPALDFAMLNLAATAEEHMNVVGVIASPAPGFHKLVATKDITGPADLAGKKIGYVEGTSEHYVTQKYLLDGGVALEDVTLVPLPGLFELVGALKNGDIDASWLWANAVAEALQDEGLVQITDDSAVLDATSISLVAGREWTEEHADEVRRVLAAFADAAEFVAGDPDATGQIVAAAVQGDAAQIASITPGQGWGLGFDQAQLDNLDALAAFLIDSGKLDADFDVRGFLNLDLMEEVAPGSVTANLG